MSQSQRSVLITGCSDGGLGAALALEFHKQGLHVYATARNVSKMKGLQAHGIETLQLDVLSDSSIKACVEKLSHLDILINNAGAGYNMPFSDLSIAEAKKVFDVNVWAYLAVSQACLPLILKSKGIIANNLSIAAVTTIPFQSTYNASKAAMNLFSDTMRLELEPFGVRVVNLLTGSVFSNLITNTTSGAPGLPKGSIYEPARAVVENTMSGEPFVKAGIPASKWAEQVVGDLIKPTPPSNIWRGASALLVRIGTILPLGTFDGMVKKWVGLDAVAKIIQA